MDVCLSARRGRQLVLTLMLATIATIASSADTASAAPSDCPPALPGVLTSVPATSARSVALTFDDGPSPRWTPQVLDVLRRNGVRATFFVNGTNVNAAPALARRIVAEGHVIGNHTLSHANLHKIDAVRVVTEIERGTTAITRATGVRPCFFRGPYGSHTNPWSQQVARDRNMTVVGWDQDTWDWQTPLSYSPPWQAEIVAKATAGDNPHPIVLMHDGGPGNYRQNTVDAVQRIVDHYRARGYAFTDPAGNALTPATAIQHHHVAHGGSKGPLGHQLTPEQGLHKGAFAVFQGGSVYWTPATGARAVRGAIRDRWGTLGWENGPLGYPVTDELPTPTRPGRYTHFQGGSIYWSPKTGAHDVRGAIRERWAATGWESGPLGYPRSGEYAVPGGRASDFEGGRVVWDRATGSTTVSLSGRRWSTSTR